MIHRHTNYPALKAIRFLWTFAPVYCLIAYMFDGKAGFVGGVIGCVIGSILAFILSVMDKDDSDAQA